MRTGCVFIFDASGDGLRTPIEPANRCGDTDAHVPHPRLFRGSNAPGEPFALLWMFDLRHVRFVTANIQKQLDHRRKGLVQFPAR